MVNSELINQLESVLYQETGHSSTVNPH